MACKACRPSLCWPPGVVFVHIRAQCKFHSQAVMLDYSVDVVICGKSTFYCVEIGTSPYFVRNFELRCLKPTVMSGLHMELMRVLNGGTFNNRTTLHVNKHTDLITSSHLSRNIVRDKSRSFVNLGHRNEPSRARFGFVHVSQAPAAVAASCTGSDLEDLACAVACAVAPPRHPVVARCLPKRQSNLLDHLESPCSVPSRPLLNMCSNHIP